MIHKLGLTAFFVVVLFFSATNATNAATMDSIRDRGFVSCGVTERMPGFSSVKNDGSWIGMNIDYCRALAAAVLKMQRQ